MCSESNISLSDRISGSLFGLLLCDALGAAVEGQSAGSFDLVTTLRGGGKFQLQPGQFTDDGSMALCLAVALLNAEETDGITIHPSFSQMDLYRRWYESGYLSSTGECFDIGITIRTALNKFISDCNHTEDQSKIQSTSAYYGSASDKASGNGSLMRLAPVPLLYHQDPHRAMNEAINSSKTTHASQLCLDSCRMYTALIIGALQGVMKDELLNSDELYVPAGLPSDYWTAETSSPLAPSVAAVMHGSYKRNDPPQIKASGFVIETLEAALWAFYHTNSFEEGALKAVNLGNDADTVGAVYGMLAGAYYGLNGIPTEWRQKCSFHSLVETIVDEILIRSQLRAVPREKDMITVNQLSLAYKHVLRVYDALAHFYSGTIKRRVLPCPKQYKCSEQLEEDVEHLRSIYENIVKSMNWPDNMEALTMDAQQQMLSNRCDSILNQFLDLIQEDKRVLAIKWSRNSSHFQMQQRLPVDKPS